MGYGMDAEYVAEALRATPAHRAAGEEASSSEFGRSYGFPATL
jgi:hypothetical protein